VRPEGTTVVVNLFTSSLYRLGICVWDDRLTMDQYGKDHGYWDEYKLP
jgi:hypothetical protein